MSQRGAINWPIAIFSFFGIIFAANAVLVYLAVNNPHQLADEQPYQRGLVHQQVIDQERAMRDAGLSASLDFLPQARGRRVVLRIVDSEGQAVQVESARLKMQWPADKQLDEAVELNSSPDSDELTASMKLPHKGLWLAALSFNYDGRQLLVRKRVFL